MASALNDTAVTSPMSNAIQSAWRLYHPEARFMVVLYNSSNSFWICAGSGGFDCAMRDAISTGAAPSFWTVHVGCKGGVPTAPMTPLAKLLASRYDGMREGRLPPGRNSLSVKGIASTSLM